MITIVGLGNKGSEYEKTRHNVGHIVLDACMRANNFPSMQKDKLANAFISSHVLKETPVEVLYPDTFMNLSGQTVSYLVHKRGINLSELVVVHDDVSLPLGTIRISVGSGTGGHNGVSSIIKAIDSQEFIRIRIGIAQKSFFGGMKKHTGSGLSDFVLKNFSKKELEILDEVSQKVEKALTLIAEKGIAIAMQECN